MPMRLLWILLLALACGPAFALGLGQIEVKSRHGQPLLAEIPIVSSDPSELEQLQARLASPETFRRIGLEPPGGLVADLQFAIALDPQGRPVIRITTVEPVQEPLLTFLVEVDWGHGRLVREYSALVDSPQTVSAPLQPPIQAPEAVPSDVIVRPAETAPADVAQDTTDATEAPEAVATEPAAVPAPSPEPARMPAPVARTPAAVSAGAELAPVRAGQTLSGIAAGIAAQTGLSLNQTMVALLRANPEAFIRGNINLLREGAVLRVPGEAEMAAADAREATAIVREQVAQWREMRRPVPQPVDAATSAAAATGTASAAPGLSEARLAIVPPGSAGTAQAGTRSGIAAGGEGDMLRQQELTQAQETIAAQGAEVEELKARVAELEQLQQQQAQLISLKDSELAAAQQRLAESNQQAAPTLATIAQDPARPDAPGMTLPWVWIGLGLLALALLAWWWASRRSVVSERTSRSFLSDRPVPKPAVAAPPAATQPAVNNDAPAPPVVAPPVAPVRLDSAAAMAASGWPNARSGEAVQEDAPPWHAGGEGEGDGATRGATIAPLNPAPAGQERLELARAYIELGDVDTARTLLQEVADSGDAGSRGEAARLLRELV
jgi:pilus assembly protein FimV